VFNATKFPAVGATIARFKVACFEWSTYRPIGRDV